MRIIEPHIHMYSRTTDDYQAMWQAGIRVVVEPAFWLGQNRRYAGTFHDYFAHILEFETERARKFGIDHYAAIAVNPKECENLALANEVIDGMSEYLDHPRCVAMGEIGLNMNTENEIAAFRRQLLIAEERAMPVVIHLPHFPKREGARIIVDIIKAEGVTEERIIIDHNTEETMEIGRETDCYLGLTVYPYSKLNPERVSMILREWGTEGVMIAGSADWGVSDPLSLIKVADYLEEDGHSEETVRAILHDVPAAFYGFSPNFQPDFGLTPVPVSEYQR
jgi:predicted metal-dependent TIM-barrel fold hydrolase